MTTLAQLMSNPLFSVYSLTASINRMPYQPGVIGDMNLFTPRPLTTTFVLIEQANGNLALVPDQPRGGAATANVEGDRNLVSLVVPHFPLRDSLLADSILGVRAFGTDNQLEGVQSAVNGKVASMDRKHDVTLEWLRLGAIKGVIVTAVARDTLAPLRTIDLFQQFGVQPQPVQNWPIAYAPGNPPTEADAWAAPIRALILSMMETMALELGGQTFTSLAAICGMQFFNAIATAPELRQTFINTPAAAQLRDSLFGLSIPYAGCEFIPYMGGVGNLSFVAPDTAYFFPRGAPDLFLEAYAPADYMETVNTMALPRYAKQELMDFDKGVEIETQQNVLPFCTRPRVLFTVKATAAAVRGGTPARQRVAA